VQLQKEMVSLASHRRHRRLPHAIPGFGLITILWQHVNSSATATMAEILTYGAVSGHVGLQKEMVSLASHRRHRRLPHAIQGMSIGVGSR
jgi:hypothetical protein